MARWIRLVSVVLFVISLLGSSSGAPALAQGTDCRTFTETNHKVCGRFLEYWDGNGGQPQQGFPLSEAMSEQSQDDGKVYTTQYFERAVFELHPEKTRPFDVLLSLLGTFQYQDRYGDEGAPGQHTSTDNPRFFSETGMTMGGLFRQYWEDNGGLAQQGYPISEEFNEVNDLDGKTYKVQYFQRAVFEYHPLAPPGFRVLLSQLGTFRYYGRAQADLAVIHRSEKAGQVNVSGGEICPQGTDYRKCAASVHGRAANSVMPPSSAVAGEIIKTYSDGTLVARILQGWIRMLGNAAVILKHGNPGAGGGLFNSCSTELVQGGILVNHTDQNFSVGAGAFCAAPIDSKFLVQVNQDGSIKVAVISGNQGVKITRPDGTPLLTVPQGKQVNGNQNGTITQPLEDLDAESLQTWDTYGNFEDLETSAGAFDLARCAFQNGVYPGMAPAVARQLGCAVEPARLYGPGEADGAAPVRYYNSGALLYDAQAGPPTMYKLYTNRVSPGGGIPGTTFAGVLWDTSATASGDPAVFLREHPEASRELGAVRFDCPAATWSVQRFAGGTVLRPPLTQLRVEAGGGCVSGASGPPLILLQDRTVWTPASGTPVVPTAIPTTEVPTGTPTETPAEIPTPTPTPQIG